MIIPWSHDDLRTIKNLVVDCDGVLTDGKYYSMDNGKRIISFSAKDSLGVYMAKSTDLKLAIISSTSQVKNVKRRAKDWGVDFYSAPCMKKLQIVSKLFDLDRTAYIGDSIDDIQVLSKVKLALVPADAIKDVKIHADYILDRKGGEGCLLEAVLALRFFVNA